MTNTRTFFGVEISDGAIAEIAIPQLIAMGMEEGGLSPADIAELSDIAALHGSIGWVSSMLAMRAAESQADARQKLPTAEMPKRLTAEKVRAVIARSFIDAAVRRLQSRMD